MSKRITDFCDYSTSLFLYFLIYFHFCVIYLFIYFLIKKTEMRSVSSISSFTFAHLTKLIIEMKNSFNNKKPTQLINKNSNKAGILIGN